eukprot:gene11759-13882_t
MDQLVDLIVTLPSHVGIEEVIGEKYRELFVTNPRKLTTLLSLLSRQSSRGGAKAAAGSRAMEVLKWVQHEGVSLNAFHYTAAISACQSPETLAAALELYEEMCLLGMGLRAQTYTALITACTRGGQAQRALDIFADMQRAGVEGDVVAYSAVISACAAQGSWQEAWQASRAVQLATSTPSLN